MALYSPQESPANSEFRKATALAIVGRGRDVLLIRKSAKTPWQLPGLPLRQNDLATAAALAAATAYTGLTGRGVEFIGYDDNKFHYDVYLGFWITVDPKSSLIKPAGILAIAWHNAGDLPSIEAGHFAIISMAMDKGKFQK